MTECKRYVLVTGSSDGIGRQLALDLVKDRENFVIVHARNEHRLRETMQYLSSKIETSDNLGGVIGDFGELKTVSAMSDELLRLYPKLNVIVCNAGVLLPKRQLSKDNLELCFQVNHLAHFLLVNKLLPCLKRNAPSRVIVISSICHSWQDSIDWDDLQAEKDYEKYVVYSRTKLMNHLFTFALHRRLAAEGVDVTSNVMEPGVVETKLLRNGGFSGSPVEQSSGTILYLCKSPEVDRVSGKYFNSSRSKISPFQLSLQEDVQERLWEVSLKICKQLGCW